MPYTKPIAIICLTILEMKALEMGINGPILLGVVGLIAGLGGYSVGKKLARIQK